jgi:hypothetical protein
MRKPKRQLFHRAAYNVFRGDLAEIVVQRNQRVLIDMYGLAKPDFQDLIHHSHPFSPPRHAAKIASISD